MKIRLWLQKQNTLVLTFYLAFTSFSTYLCVYALRKPFTAGTYEGQELWGIDYKIVLVIAHVLGYATSKLLGIKYITEVTPQNRAKMISQMAFWGLLALFLFALIPPPYNFVMMYLNGLPLGMMYGLVLGNLEGRKVTEILGAVLCVSFIFGAGVVKTVGRWLILDLNVSDYWMPFCAGAIFFLPLFIFNYLLSQAPPPSSADQASRTVRLPMNAQARKILFLKYWPGFVSLILVYVIVTILRDIRENFAVEIFKEFNITDIGVFTFTETLVGLSVTLLVGFLFIVKDNRKALWLNYLFVGVGMALVIVCTYFFRKEILSITQWMILVGLGIYMAYVPYNCTLYERLIASSKEQTNISFLLYPADFCGYIGSVGIMLIKNFGEGNISWLNYYVKFAYSLPIVAMILMIFSLRYFHKKLPKD